MKTININNHYVIRCIVLSLIVGIVPIICISWFIYNTENLEQLLFIPPFVTVILIIILVHTYMSAGKQNIVLQKNRIVFNWSTISQSFEFNNVRDFCVKDKGCLWIVYSITDGSRMKITKHAFPGFSHIVDKYYKIT